MPTEKIKTRSVQTASQELSNDIDLSGLSEETKKAVLLRKKHLESSKDADQIKLFLENPEAVFRADLEIFKKQPKSKRVENDIAWIREILSDLVKRRLAQSAELKVSKKEPAIEITPEAQAPEIPKVTEPVTPEAASTTTLEDKKGEKIFDPLYGQALRIVTDTGQMTPSYLQRRLSIGYSRAAAIVERMEDEGVVSHSEVGTPRKILWTNEQIKDFLDTHEFPLQAPAAQETSTPSVAEEDKTAKEIAELQETIRKIKERIARRKEDKALAKKLQKELLELKETFPTQFIYDTVHNLLSSQDSVKAINKLEITGTGDSIKLEVEITASKMFITTTIKIENAVLVNQGDNIKLQEGYTLSATKAEGIIKEFVGKNIDSMGDQLKKFIEKKKGKKVEKIWIEKGQLNVMF